MPTVVAIVMGVAGSGKSTLSQQLFHERNATLSQFHHVDLIEGDDWHPASNVAKMGSGQPLTDDDRWPWLQALVDQVLAKAGSCQRSNGCHLVHLVLIACSCLKRIHRDFLRLHLHAHRVVFLYLHGSRQLLLDRLESRAGHFMKASMLDSQLKTLEPPEESSEHVLCLDVSLPLTDLTAAALDFLNKNLITYRPIKIYVC
jgi:gluconokinase